ncbi:MAG: ECF transporter S component [Eggerthia catenaformis]|nr:ECF transporter S component [Eggerthia catenaformis]
MQTSYGIVKLKENKKVLWITITGLFMAINIGLSSFGIPVPGGHLYLCDAIICTAALLLDPFAALLVGGIGSFLGDMIFYPAPMFVSLIVHGLQAFVISYIVHTKAADKDEFLKKSLIALIIGSIIMVIGYTLGKTFVYSTFQYAMLKLPYEIAQALLGSIIALLVCFKGNLLDFFRKLER